MEWNQHDIEYVMEYLEKPECLTGEEFVRWLDEKEEHRALFEAVLSQREAFFRRKDQGQIDVEAEYGRFVKELAPRRSVKWWGWSVVAASVMVFFWVGLVMFFRLEPQAESMQAEVFTGKRSVELVLANGQRVNLDHNVMELQEENGIWIINDSNSLLAYCLDTLSMEGGNSDTALMYNTLRIPAGADYIVHLADGTRVHLNCESQFRYPVSFAGNERRVYLDGEAFFEVKKAGEWPFVVVTDEMNIRVTGTTFNVKSYRKDQVITTTLVSGSVQVESDEMGQRVVQLLPSQQFEWNKITRRRQVREVDVSLYTGWTEGLFVFRNVRLEEVMTVLARWYPIEVFYASPSVKDLKLSANLGRYENIDTIVAIIQAMDKINVVRKGNTIMIDWK